VKFTIKTTSLVLILALLNLTTRCTNYSYNLKYDFEPDKDKILALNKARNLIVLHQGFDRQNPMNPVWTLTNVNYDDQTRQITGIVNKPHESIRKYLTINPETAKVELPDIYKKINDEIHIFAQSVKLDGNKAFINLQDISRLELINYSTERSTKIVSASAIAFIIIIPVVLLLTKDSCPYLFIKNGESYSFIGEIFSGAIYGSLERDDYLPLPSVKPINGKFNLKIANHLKEKQYVNQAELWYIQHPKGLKVIADKNGEIYSLGKAFLPVQSFSENGKDLSEYLMSKDSIYYPFDEESPDHNINSVFLSFSNPDRKDKAKLILNARNSLWGDYVFGEFTKYFGRSYPNWISKQKTNPTFDHLQWQLDQGVALKAYIKNSGEWKLVDFQFPVGPMAARDIVIQLDLSETKGDNFEIKLTSGFKFWDLDYAAIDYTKDEHLEILKLSPLTATDFYGRDIRKLIQNSDDSYLEQLKVGEEAKLSFAAPQINEDFAYSLLFHSKGYYEHIRDYKGLPNIIALNRFKKPGEFSTFSREQLIEMELLFGTATVSETYLEDE